MLFEIFGVLMLSVGITGFDDTHLGCSVEYYGRDEVFIGHTCEEVKDQMILTVYREEEE